MSKDLIDETLFCLFCGVFNYSSEEDKQNRTAAYSAIEWYVNTSRACSAFITALHRANPEKILRHCAKHAGTYDETIAACSAYLKRYCGMN